MRVVFCLNGPNEINGPNVWLLRHLPQLRERGLSPEVLYLSYRPELPCYFRDTLAAQGFRIRTAMVRRNTELTVQEIWRALADAPPDVFVPNYSVPAYYAARFLREAGVITVGIVHSDDPFYHDLIDLFVGGDERWRLSGVVAVSNFLLELLSRCPEAAKVARVLAPCGVPLPEARGGRGTGPLRLVYLGRLSEHQKRIGRVAARLAAAAEQIPDVEATIYGEGPDCAAVQAVVERPRHAGRLTLGGALCPAEVFPVLQASHVLVLLSDFEGMPVSLLEAMAAGVVPILSRMRSGCTEIIDDGRNGFVVDADDEAAFLAIVRRLASANGEWDRMSRAARQTVIDGGLSSAVCAERWVGFLRHLQAKTGRPVAQLAPLPPIEDWQLPPRCTRPGGIRGIDRRALVHHLAEALHARRDIFLWGASEAGRIFLSERPDLGPRICGFVDSNPMKHGTTYLGVPVFAPDALRKVLDTRPFVVITSQYEAEIGAELAAMGFAEGLDYAAV